MQRRKQAFPKIQRKYTERPAPRRNSMVGKEGKGMEIGLDRLRAGERGTVLRLELPPSRAAALTRLGLLPGTGIVCLRISPLGDPAAFLICGSAVALRRADCRRIEVEG